jgi:hypothetical protein
MGELGELLRGTREAKGLSIAEVAAATRIRQGFLEALEAEEFSRLPSEVALRGFLRNYALFLGLNPEDVLAMRGEPPGPGRYPPIAPPVRRQAPAAMAATARAGTAGGVPRVALIQASGGVWGGPWGCILTALLLAGALLVLLYLLLFGLSPAGLAEVRSALSPFVDTIRWAGISTSSFAGLAGAKVGQEVIVTGVLSPTTPVAADDFVMHEEYRWKLPGDDPRPKGVGLAGRFVPEFDLLLDGQPVRVTSDIWTDMDAGGTRSEGDRLLSGIRPGRRVTVFGTLTSVDGGVPTLKARMIYEGSREGYLNQLAGRRGAELLICLGGGGPLALVALFIWARGKFW